MTVNWKKVEKNTHLICQPTIDLYFSKRDLAIPKGTPIKGIFIGYSNEESIFRTHIQPLDYEGIFGLRPNEITVTLLDSKRCFRCEWDLSLNKFKRHPLTQDKSLILSEVCESCYRGAKNKIGSYASEARKYGGKTGLRVSEWLELLKASQGRCHYCHINIGFEALVLEHCISLSLRGDNTKENVVPACHGCNSSKAGKDFETWKTCIEDRRLMVRLQEHFGLSKSEVTNLAIKTLAQKIGFIDGEIKS